MRVLGDLRGFVVADVAVEGGYLHEVLVQILLDLLEVGLDAVGAVLVEGGAGVADQLDGLQDAPGRIRPTWVPSSSTARMPIRHARRFVICPPVDNNRLPDTTFTTFPEGSVTIY